MINSQMYIPIRHACTAADMYSVVQSIKSREEMQRNVQLGEVFVFKEKL